MKEQGWFNMDLQTTNLKILGWTFQGAKPWGSSFTQPSGEDIFCFILKQHHQNSGKDYGKNDKAADAKYLQKQV